MHRLSKHEKEIIKNTIDVRIRYLTNFMLERPKSSDDCEKEINDLKKIKEKLENGEN